MHECGSGPKADLMVSDSASASTAGLTDPGEPLHLDAEIPGLPMPQLRSRRHVCVSFPPRVPDRAERRLRLISAIARGRRWLDEIIAGSITDAGQLVKRERCTVRQINMTLSLAFLAPALVKAAVEGRVPRGINIERLRDPDPIWAKQFHDLGLNPN